jgi:hypothetical protein
VLRLPPRLASCVLAAIVLHADRAAAARAPLVDAAKQADRAAVRALLDQGAAVNGAEPDGTTALHGASAGQPGRRTR